MMPDVALTQASLRPGRIAACAETPQTVFMHVQLVHVTAITLT